MTDPRNDNAYDSGRDADSFVRRLGDSAQQVWLAGLGAFNRAQAEGSRLFDTLVSEGREYEQKHKDADASGLRGNVEAGLGQARERSQHTWNKIEQAFDDQVQGVLKRLNMPVRADVTALENELQVLRQRLGELEGQFARHQVRCTCGTKSDTTGTPFPPAGPQAP